MNTNDSSTDEVERTNVRSQWMEIAPMHEDTEDESLMNDKT